MSCLELIGKSFPGALCSHLPLSSREIPRLCIPLCAWKARDKQLVPEGATVGFFPALLFPRKSSCPAALKKSLLPHLNVGKLTQVGMLFLALCGARGILWDVGASQRYQSSGSCHFLRPTAKAEMTNPPPAPQSTPDAGKSSPILIRI